MQDIWHYIAEDNPVAADRVESELYAAFAKLADNPYMGHMREDITGRSVRFWSVYSYQIIYRPDTSPLQVVRVLSGYRDLGDVLAE